MIVSIAEAEQRWCPFARAQAPVVSNKGAVIVGAVSANRLDGAPDKDCMCIAARCMAWRFADPKSGYCGLVAPTHHQWSTT